MDAQRYTDDLQRLQSTLRRSQYLNLALVVGLLLALWISLGSFGRERTIVTPPGIEKSFWITSGNASESYVEEMALWIANLILDVTPDNIDYKATKLLEYADPRAHGALKERQMLESARIKRDNATTYFSLETIRVHPEKLAALISGRMHTLINGTPVPEQNKNYFVRFRLDHGRASLIQFEEIPHVDIAKALAEAS